VAKALLEDVLHRAPPLWGLTRSRWWLDGLRQVVPWPADYSLMLAYVAIAFGTFIRRMVELRKGSL
jgi:hypothetical protein